VPARINAAEAPAIIVRLVIGLLRIIQDKAPPGIWFRRGSMPPASFFRVGVFWLTGGVVPQSIFADARLIKCPGILWYSMVG